MTVHECPNCSRPMGAPLSSGRQVCAGCGWASRPKLSEGEKQESKPFPNTPLNLMFYGAGAVVALVAALYSSDGYQLTCERAIATQGGVCRITKYNYLGQSQMVRGFPTSSLVSAKVKEERVRRRRRRRSSSYTRYHLVLITRTGEVTTPLNSRNRREIEKEVQQVQRFTGNSVQTLLRISDRGAPMTNAAIFMGGSVFVVHYVLSQIQKGFPFLKLRKS